MDRGSSLLYTIRPEQARDAMAVERFHDRVLGPARFALTAVQMRLGVPPCLEFSRLAILTESFEGLAKGKLVGCLRITRARVGRRDVSHCTPAYLLGPLAVDPLLSGRRIARTLIARSVEALERRGPAFVFLVGDHPYYGPQGFLQIPHGQITLPGPVDPNRFLVCPLAGAGPLPQGQLEVLPP